MRWPLSRPLTTTCWVQLVCYPYDKPYVVGAMNSPSFTDTEAEQQRRWREGLQPRAPGIILLYLPLSGWILGPDPLQSHFQAPQGCKTPGDGGLGGSSQDISQSVSSVAQSCPILCNSMDWSTPGLPVHSQFPELTQTHVHRVRDAIQPSHPLLSPSPPAFSLSQNQGLF